MQINLSLSNRYVYFFIKRLDKQRHESEVWRPGAGSEEAKNIRTCSNESRTLITQPHTQCHTHKNTQLCELVSSKVSELLLCFYWTDADLARLCITCKRISAPVQQLINNSILRRIWRATDLEKLKLSPARLAYVRHAELNSLPSVFHDLSNLETFTYYDRFHVLTNSNMAAIGNCSQLRSLTLDACHELTDIHSLGNCIKLQKLNLYPCTNLTNITGLRNCSSLKSLTLGDCSKLTDITALVAS